MEVPFTAKRLMQQAIYELLLNGYNEWTTWTDAIILAEAAVEALEVNGWEVRHPNAC